MIPVKVTKISYHSESKSYAVILKEITGEKCIPVIVGSFEAQSIALAIETVDTPRPLTHDLICDLISGVDGVLNAVRINSLDKGIFFSQLEIESIKLGKRIIDARPSDAIAIALRMDTPILVAKKVLEEAGLLEDSLKQEKPKRKKEEISIDLNEEKIIYGNSKIKFDVDSFKKKCLLEGLDDIALSLEKSDKIENFEKNLKNQKPWIIND